MKKLTMAVLLAACAPLAGFAQLAAPSGLTGTADDGKLVLSWDAPEFDDTVTPTVDGFESYAAYARENIGEWTMIDVDGIGSGIWYNVPNYNYDLMQEVGYDKEMAWTVLSNAKFTRANFTPIEGEHVLAAFMAYGDTDDWAVSPKLNGEAQKITFKAISLKATGGTEATETITVYISKAGTAKDDMEYLTTITVEPGRVENCSFDVPEGTNHFALVYRYAYGVSSPCYGVAVDCVSYLPEGAVPLELQGFNIYCDGKKINDNVVATTSYTITDGDKEAHNYTVTAVYNLGESEPSEAFAYTTEPEEPAIVGTAPTGLTGTAADGKLVLTWDAPEFDDTATPTVDGFETYKAYARENIGEWTMIDVDGKGSGVWYNVPGYDYDLMQEVGYDKEMAWTVMSNAKFSRANFSPIEGEHVLAAFMAYGDTEDWAVSPKLNGEAQKITFKAISLKATGGTEATETITVYISKAGTAKDDMEYLTTITVEPGRVENCSFNVPEGTNHFALVYRYAYGVSSPCYGVAVDCVSYLAEGAVALELQGFNIYCDGKKINDSVVAATSYTIEGGDMEAHSYTVTAVYNLGESEPSEAFVYTTEPEEPATVGTAPTGLKVSKNGNHVDLEWDAPEFDDTVEPVVENFESYAAYARENIGQWTMIDTDGIGSGIWYNVPGYDYELMQEVGYDKEMAWTVLSNAKFSRPNFSPIEGSQVLAAFMAYGDTEDWAVSPKLNGEAQKITFKAISLKGATTPESAESIAVYISKAGTAKDDMTYLTTITVEPGDVNNCSFNVPEGTNHFAFVYRYAYGVSSPCYGVAVDEITYLPEGAVALELTGFNVYCDKEKVNDNVVAATKYTHLDAAAEDHDYHVTALFTAGESEPSEVVSYVRGTDDINSIASELDADMNAEVYNLQGIKVGIVNDLPNLPAGIYICNGRKILVK